MSFPLLVPQRGIWFFSPLKHGKYVFNHNKMREGIRPYLKSWLKGGHHIVNCLFKFHFPKRTRNIGLPEEHRNHSDCVHFPAWCPHWSRLLGSVLGYNRVSGSSYLHWRAVRPAKYKHTHLKLHHCECFHPNPKFHMNWAALLLLFNCPTWLKTIVCLFLSAAVLLLFTSFPLRPPPDIPGSDETWRLLMLLRYQP